MTPSNKWMTPTDVEKSVKRPLTDVEIVAISRLRGHLPEDRRKQRESCDGRARKLGWPSSVRHDKQPNQSAVVDEHSEHNNDGNGHHHFGSERRTFKPLKFHNLAICCNPNGS